MISHRSLRRLAALAWCGGAASLLWRGTMMLLTARSLGTAEHWLWLSLAGGVLVGLLKGRYILLPTFRRNLARIDALPCPRWWRMYSGRLLFLVLAMIVSGVFIARWALASRNTRIICVIGAVELAVGLALAVSGLIQFRARRSGGERPGRGEATVPSADRPGDGPRERRTVP